MIKIAQVKIMNEIKFQILRHRLKLKYFSFEELLQAYEKAKNVILKEEKGVPRFYIK